ncbi:MAG TPA: SDR family NAD(P)-dependent oxidoreductase [Devosiaceae bacterium]|jgi:short-subunit dehydrogenase
MSRKLLVIGAGPGIGLETARRFAREGFEIILASRSPEKLAPQIATLTGEGAAVTTEILDATNGAAVTALVERYNGTIDTLLYNAAALRFGPTIDQIEAETLDTDIQLDLSSALRAIKAALPGMAANGHGTILLTGGTIADTPHPAALTLSVGKSGLRTAAQALFEPLKAQNIHIAVLTIGATVKPESDTAREIAQAFWEMHASANTEWHWERRYPLA